MQTDLWIKILAIVALLFSMPNSQPNVTNSLDYKIFSSDAFQFIVLPTGLLSYTKKSQDFKSIVLDETSIQDSILDVVESDGHLWFLTPSGVFQFDMETQTIEKAPFFRNTTCDGKITADLDYVWLACPDTLMQFDKLGREWLYYDVEKSPAEEGYIASAYSNGDEVYLAYPGEMKVFYIMDEKWRSFKIPKGKLSESVHYLVNQDNIFLIDDTKVYRFIITSRSWEIITSDSRIVDARIDSKKLYYVTDNNAYAYDFALSSLMRFDIKALKGSKSIEKVSDKLFIIVQSLFRMGNLNIHRTPDSNCL